MQAEDEEPVQAEDEEPVQAEGVSGEESGTALAVSGTTVLDPVFHSEGTVRSETETGGGVLSVVEADLEIPDAGEAGSVALPRLSVNAESVAAVAIIGWVWRKWVKNKRALAKARKDEAQNSYGVDPKDLRFQGVDDDLLRLPFLDEKGQPRTSLGIDNERKPIPMDNGEKSNNVRYELVRDLMRIRNATTLSSLTHDTWETWAKNAEYIETIAIEVFLNDSLLKWTAKQNDLSRAVNPKSEVRRNAFAKVNSNLRAVRMILVEHLRTRDEATTAVKAANDAATSQSNLKTNIQADVRKHTAVAAVVGTAIARAVLGDGAPLIDEVRHSSATGALTVHDRDDLLALCARMQTMFELTNGPESLRLNELCSIMQHELP